MKFRVTAKDLTIFILFCIFLLILCSLGVLNVTAFLNEGELYGLNFIAGFFPPYLPYTIVCFIAFLAFIFATSSSSIFERVKGSKGVGLDFSKKEEKGYSRWMDVKEMKKASGIAEVKISDSKFKGAGIPFINDGKNMWVDNSEYHSLVIGMTGSGKSTSLVDPQLYSLIKHDESMIIMDLKGDLYHNVGEILQNHGYNVIVLNFREPDKGSAWNPLALPYKLYKEGNVDKAIELLEDVAVNILYDQESKADPFWEKSAADYFCALALGLFKDAKEEQINLSSINYMANIGEERMGASTYIKEYFNLKGEKSSEYVFASGTINAADETKQSILSVFRQKIRMFTSRELLSEMLSYSDFDMEDIGKKKTAVFIVIHDEKTTYHSLATIFLKQVYETLIDVALHSEKGKLPFRTNFILDEFANMPPLKDITTMVSASRSRDIRFTFIIQNFSQLNDVYGKETAETIRSNCGNIIYLLTNELAALEEISKLCGEVKSKEKEKTASTPLITVSDLQKLKMNEIIVIRSRFNPFRNKMTPSYSINWGLNGFGEGKFITRERKNVSLFEVKDYVKENKRNKLFEALESNPNIKSGMPGNFPGGGMPIGNIFASPNGSSKPNIPPFMIPNEGAEDEINKSLDSAKKFDIDSLVKRIDAKIAELEEQERLEAQSKPKETVYEDIKPEIKANDSISMPSIKPDEKINTSLNTQIEDQIREIEEPTETFNFGDLLGNTSEKKTEDAATVNIDNDSVVFSDTTDDEYYDDFFSDN